MQLAMLVNSIINRVLMPVLRSGRWIWITDWKVGMVPATVLDRTGTLSADFSGIVAVLDFNRIAYTYPFHYDDPWTLFIFVPYLTTLQGAIRVEGFLNPCCGLQSSELSELVVEQCLFFSFSFSVARKPKFFWSIIVSLSPWVLYEKFKIPRKIIVRGSLRYLKLFGHSYCFLHRR